MHEETTEEQRELHSVMRRRSGHCRGQSQQALNVERSIQGQAPSMVTGMDHNCLHSLPHRLSLFVDAYVNSHNAAQAAAFAGYGIRSARKTGYRLLKRPDVSKAIRERQAQAAKVASCETDRVIQALARIVRFNPSRLFSDDGGLLSLSELPEEVAAGIASVEIRVHPNGTSVTRYRFHDKVAAIDKAMRLLGLYDSPRNPSTNAISELVQHVAKHNQPLAASESTCSPDPK